MDNQQLSRLFARMPDREAFSDIYAILKQPVFTICLRILRNRESAEDVCHDLFVKLYTTPPDPSLHNLRAWVFRMARNLAIDALRSQQIRSGGTPQEEEISFCPDWDTRLDLEAAIASLTLREREVLTLHISVGLTFSQIALITGDSLPSVYRTYRRSLKRLRQILAWILDDSSVTFVTQTYSRNYLFAIMEDVNTYFEKDLGFMSAGPSEYDNVVYIELHTDYENNPDSLAAVSELEEKYGSAVSISFTDTVYYLTLEESTPAPVLVVAPPGPATPLPMLLMLSVAVLIALILTERRRRKLLTHMGIVTQTPLSPRQVADQVRGSAPEVPATLDSRIHATLDDLSR